MTPPAGPPGSGPPGFEFPGSGRPRGNRTVPPPRRPLLALPGGRPGDTRDRDGRGRRGWPARAGGTRWERLRALVSSARTSGGTADGAAPSPLSAVGVKRWAVRAALPMVSMVAVGVAVVAAFGGGDGGIGPAPANLSVGFPPATPAGNDFSTTPADAARGISQALAHVASSGSLVVATGSQTGARIGRAQFFVSADGGRTWALGTEQAAGGGDPAPGHPATLIAGGQGQWAALGPSAIWTSRDGMAWTLASAQGIAPMRDGDQVNVLRRTAGGFLAVGENVPPGDPAAASPVVWTSANGVNWRRLGAAQLHLTAGGGTAGALTSAAVAGKNIVVSGVTTANVAQGTVRSSGVWRSTDNGTTWTAVTVPVSNGATAAVGGLAATANGLVAVRPGQSKAGTGAVVFTSADGAAWKFAATVTAQGGAGLTVATVDGGPAGAVITGSSAGNLLAFTSISGTAWRPVGVLGSATAGTIAGVAVTTGGAVVAAGSTAAGPLGQQPTLTLDNAGRLTPVNFARIPGAVEPQVAVGRHRGRRQQPGGRRQRERLPRDVVLRQRGNQLDAWHRCARGRAEPAGPADADQRRARHRGLGRGRGCPGRGGPAPGRGHLGGAARPGRPPTRPPPSPAPGSSPSPPRPAGTVTSSSGASRSRGARSPRPGGRPASTGWQRGTDAAAGALDGAGVSRQMLAATADAGGFVAVGAAGARPAAWISPDGRTWRAVTLALPMNSVRAQLQRVTINGRRIVATGMSATSGGQTAPFAALSVNGGATWTESLLPSPGGAATVDAVTATGAGFTATGTFGADGHQDVVIWTAADGLNWKTNSPSVTGLGGQGIQQITALTVSGSTLTGVGFAASPTGETPTIWRSPIRG